LRTLDLDLSVLDTDDLRALRLGAQVLGHRAALEARPRVATFFAALTSGADTALARRGRLDGAWSERITLTLDESGDRPDENVEDRRLLVEYVNLLGGNPRLTAGVRGVFVSLGERLFGSP
jgi:hypothetical protein